MPRLHRAKTVAWGLLKWGMCAWMVCVHSVTRGWQDILFLLGCMGYIATHTTPAGRHVLPFCLAGRNIIDSKTYPRKFPPPPRPDHPRSSSQTPDAHQHHQGPAEARRGARAPCAPCCHTREAMALETASMQREGAQAL